MAERKIVTRLVIEGEKEYRQALRNANAEISVSRSELQKLKEQYAENQNGMEALRKKEELLERIHEKQAEKIGVLKDALENAKSAQEKYAAEVAEAQEKVNAAEKDLEELSGTVGENSEEYQAASERLNRYNQELDEAAQRQQLCTNSVNDWQAKLNTAEGQQEKTNRQIAENRKYLEEAERSADNCATSIDRYGKKQKEAKEETEEGTEALKENSGAVDALAGALAAAGVKEGFQRITEAINECVQAAEQFETAMAKVSTVAGETADMEKMTADVLELSGAMGISAGEISEAAYNAISASVDAADAVDFVEKANKLAVAGFTDSATAVDVMTTAINAYGLSSSEASQVADYLITTQNLGKTTVNELAAAMGRVIPVAGAYGVKMDNLSSAMAILTRNGMGTAEATTYLQGMLQELGDSGSNVSKVLKEKTGSSFAALNTQGKNLGEVLEILYQSVNGDATAFNDLWSSATAGTAALSIAGSGVRDYGDVMDRMADSVGATEAAYKTMTDTAEYAGKRMQTSVENLKIAIGDQLSPALVEMENGVTDVAQAATEFVGSHPEVVAAMGALTSVMGVLTAAVLGYNVVIKIGSLLTKDFVGVLSGNPVGLVALAMTALVAAVGAYVAILGDATGESRELAEGMGSLREGAQESAAAYKEASEEYRKNADNIRSLWEEVQELASKEGKTAEEKERLIDKVRELNEAVPELGLAYDELTDSLNMTAQAAEELLRAQEGQEAYDEAIRARTEAYTAQKEAQEGLAEAQEGLAAAQEELARAQETYDGMVQGGVENLMPYADAVSTAKINVENYRKAVEDASAAIESCDETIAIADADAQYYGLVIADLDEKTRALVDETLGQIDALGRGDEAWQQSVNALEVVTKKHGEQCAIIREDINGIEEEMADLKESYAEAYQSAYDSVTGQMGLFDTMTVESKKSIDDMLAALDDQIAYLDAFSENMAKAVEMGVDKGLLEKLSDGSVESAAILQEIVNSGEDKVDQLNKKLESVEEGKNKFAEQMAELKTDFGETMEGLQNDLDEATQKMNRENEAYENGVNTIQGYINGSESKRESLLSKFGSLASAALESFKKMLDINSPSKKFEEAADYTFQGVEVSAEKNEEKVSNSYAGMARKALTAYEDESRRMRKVLEQKSGVVYNMISREEDGGTKGQEAYSVAIEGFLASMAASSTQLQREAQQRAAGAGTGAMDCLERYLPYLEEIAARDGAVYLDGKEVTDAVESRISRMQRLKRGSGGE